MKVPATAIPKYSLGDVVKIDKLGLCDHADPAPHASDYTIIGLRFQPDVEEDDDGCPVVNYGDGWEYQLARIVPATDVKAARYMEWGWETEAKLVKAGYPVTSAAALESAMRKSFSEFGHSAELRQQLANRV